MTEGPERESCPADPPHLAAPAARAGRALLLPCLALAAALAGCSGSGEYQRTVRAAIEQRLERSGRFAVTGDDVRRLARRFYDDRGFRPAWVTSRGPTRDAHDMVEAIEAAPRNGLDPRRYGLDSLQATMKALDAGLFGPAPDPERLAALDVRLTRAFLVLASDLGTGAVNPKLLPPEWHLGARKLDPVVVLGQALERHRVRTVLEDLPPSDSRYTRLRDLLARYRAIEAQGGWTPVPQGKPMRRGQRGDRVQALRARLTASGDLAADARAKPVFDAATEEAVRRFQRRHGLDADGVVGGDDLAAMNVPVGRRVHQIELNLERGRWRSQPLGERYVVVNIPDYSLQVIEDERPVLSMRVVVGERFKQTPLFSDEITYLVLNPWWSLPPSIIVNEILPAMAQDDHYLEQHEIHVFDGPGPDASELDAHTIHWKELTPEDFDASDPKSRKIFLRQEPGTENPLGRIKFMCPNQFDIYLHDTPAGHLFSAKERDFSHGCIRLEKPFDLAEYLLHGQVQSDHKELLAALATSRDSTIRLPKPIPVHLVYWTAWVDEQGEAQFRDDVYAIDLALDMALRDSGTIAWSATAWHGRR